MITKEMGITDIVTKFPKAGYLLMSNGMGCVGCLAAQFETLEQGAAAHGLNVDSLVDLLNKELGLS